MSDKLAQLKSLMPRRLILLDVGARFGLQWPWTSFQHHMHHLLIEPDGEEAARLRARVDPKEATVIERALWNRQEELTLYLTATRGCSSVFRPNRAVLDQFADTDRFAVEETIRVSADPVDALVASGALGAPDVAKIDTQGSELNILRGGRATFARSLVCLEVEVEFVAMYERQPLFADVDTFVRQELGLELWDVRKTFWKYRGGMRYGSWKGRAIFGDALYFRPLDTLPQWLANLDQGQLSDSVTMLIVAASAYGYLDYAVALCDAPDVRSVLGTETTLALRRAVERSGGSGVRPIANGNRVIYTLLDAVARSFKRTYNGHATGGDELGSRKWGPFWI